MPEIRLQPIRASVGMMAEEHARLDRVLEAKRKEIEAMTATPTPSGDDLMRALAKEIEAEEARTATKRAALARAESQLRTQTRDRIEEMQRIEQQRLAELRADLAAFHSAKLAALAEAQEHLRHFVACSNAAVDAHLDLQRTALALAAGQRTALTSNLSPDAFIRRQVGRICSYLRTLKVPGRMGATADRIGELTLPISSLYSTDDDWAAKEDTAAGAEVRAVIEGRIA